MDKYRDFAVVRGNNKFYFIPEPELYINKTILSKILTRMKYKLEFVLRYCCAGMDVAPKISVTVAKETGSVLSLTGVHNTGSLCVTHISSLICISFWGDDNWIGGIGPQIPLWEIT